MALKSVLITGSNRGIGLEFVRQLMGRDGVVHVFACCRDPTKANELKVISDQAANTVRVHPVKMDVTNDAQIKDAVKYVESVVGNDGLNLLINNAGILNQDSCMLPTVDRGSMMEHMDINAVSPVMVTQAFLPLLRKAADQHKSGTKSIFNAGVVNVSSGIGSITDNTSGSSHTGYGYRISKAALNSATKCLAVDLKNDHILFISVCPGWVKTDMGGPEAMITAKESVETLLGTFARLNETHNGGYFKRDGTVIPF